MRKGRGWFRARELFNTYMGNREEWKLQWGSRGQQDMDNKLQSILAGREPDQRDKDGLWRRFIHLLMESQGSSWRSLWSPKKGSEDSAGGKGLATALGMDEDILCILLFFFYLHINVSKGRLGHPGRNSAAVTGTMICFLLPFSVQFPRWMSKRGLWEVYCNGKSWWAASRSWFSLCCPPSVGLKHRVGGFGAFGNQ